MFRSGRHLRHRRTPKLVLHATDTNAHIKVIVHTAIDDPEWKNPTDFGEFRKIKMAHGDYVLKI